MKTKCICFFVLLLHSASAVFAQTSFTFSGKPVYEIEARRNSASLGIIKVELFPAIAPLHVRNFDSLVSHSFYDSTAFHRVIKNFMIQGGDPNSRSGTISTWGYGDPSQPTVPAEFSLLRHERGILSAARKGGDINSATSQFFICVAAAPGLDGQYSAYGRVISGMDVVDTIVNAPTTGTPDDRPLDKIEMFVTRTGSDEEVPGAPVITSPAYGARDLGLSVPLKWQAVNGALLYNVELSTDSTFETKIDSMVVRALQLTKNQLQDSSIYYWRIRANNGGNFSPFAYGKFSTIGETTGITTFEQGRQVMVFPNPGTGLFQFKGLKAGTLIQVYDAEGKLIKSEKTQGEELLIDLKTSGRGMYIYKLVQDGSHAGEGRMIIR